MMEAKKIVVAIAIICLVALAFRGTTTGLVTSAVCGNNFCELGENKGNCPADCRFICGDNLCEDLEGKTCPQDCTASARDGEKTKAFSSISFLALAIILIALVISVCPFILKKQKPKHKRKKSKSK